MASPALISGQLCRIRCCRERKSGRWACRARRRGGRSQHQAAARGDGAQPSRRAIRRCRSTTIGFDAEVEPDNTSCAPTATTCRARRSFPRSRTARVRIAALAQLTGSAQNQSHRLERALPAARVRRATRARCSSTSCPKRAWRSSISRRRAIESGGFMQPNLKPSAISRLTGPVTGNVDQLHQRHARRERMRSRRLVATCRCRCLFGCIPLGEVIERSPDLAGKPEQVPKFASGGEHAGRELHQRPRSRSFDFVSKLADQPGRARRRGGRGGRRHADDLLDQAAAYAAPLVADASTARINQLHDRAQRRGGAGAAAVRHGRQCRAGACRPAGRDRRGADGRGQPAHRGQRAGGRRVAAVGVPAVAAAGRQPRRHAAHRRRDRSRR